MSSREETLTIVGAGLVGSLLSLFLAKRGYIVEVYERRSDLRKESKDRGRSINLAISERGLHALREVGIEAEVLEQAVPMKGRMIHPRRGFLSFQPYGKEPSQYINSVSRADLNKRLIARAEATGRVRFYFNHRLLSADFKRSTLTFRSAEEENITIQTARIFGTDGAHSAVRQAMEETLGYEVTQDLLDYGYKELVIPSNEGIKLERNALHIWPRGTYMLIALPNCDGSFTCTLFLPLRGKLSFESLSTTEVVTSFFVSEFPDASSLMPDLIDDFFRNPTGNMVTVKSFPWSVRGTALLLGDAAHAIVPFFGQGMNCGFEDCSVLSECLAEAEEIQWEEVFSRFTRLRKQNADAIAAMALENFIEMRDKVADPAFILQKEIEKQLQKIFPDEYVSRYQMVTFSRVPYQTAYEIGRREEEILDDLSASAGDLSQVDFSRAERLVKERLLPMMKSARGK